MILDVFGGFAQLIPCNFRTFTRINNQKMRRVLPFLFLMLALTPAFADIAIEGQVTRKTVISNLSEFPDYEFYIQYQNYYYEYGYQPGSVDEVILVEGEAFESGERGSRSKIYARLKKKKRKKFESEETVGGQEVIPDRNGRYIEDVVRIISVEEGVIKFEIESSSLILRNGDKENLLKKGGITGLTLFGVDLAYIGLPLFCLIAFALFLMRKRAMHRQEAA